MPRRRVSRLLVIDASVASASGDKAAVHPTAVGCREFLRAVLNICHRAVMTADIKREWDDHQSRFARGWRVQMRSKNKLFDPGVSSNNKLRKKMERTAVNNRDREAILKDAHLIEAAITTELIVISLDETARRLFAEATKTVDALRGVVWVNPENSDEGSIDWLEKGAKVENKRRLGPAI